MDGQSNTHIQSYAQAGHKQRDSFHNQPFASCPYSAISFSFPVLMTGGLDLFFNESALCCFVVKHNSEGCVCNDCRRPAACFLATWHACSRRHCRPLPSWMTLTVRLVCHEEASQLPPNTQPSVCIHEQEWQRTVMLDRFRRIHKKKGLASILSSLCRHSELSSAHPLSL